MSSSQSSNQIHYTNKEAWEEYLNKLKELLSIVSGIRTLRDRLDRELKRPLSELADNETYLKLLFGGVMFEKGNINYLDKSLAKIVLKLFSVGLSADELARIGNELEGGRDLKKLNVIPKSYETTPFMKNLEGLWISLSNVLQIRDLNAREYGVDSLSTAFTDLINTMGPLLPTYNELSFFIYSLSGAPRFYINEEYPEFSKSDTFQPIDNFKITLETILRDPLGRDQFSIVGVKSSPGRSIINSLDLMFDIFAILRK
ncbi:MULTISPECIES: hypothetical protein [Metallosphaera]|uniref:Uncharacterized protein n=3 Tax=Metallosphaera TaxID=41980 RepID=A4YFZ6_METS5|nr:MULTISPECIES: hypothetical protein [Metallosphaera]ABP95348.1 hypothetical protein Msed_1187 [Metallosphaera sedula DSM 5348]AIM27334.1 hypothetical protein HA72_1187 [Metallosphaera sedula]AKV74214.1 hypothetical protein MsedA_1204 [Metallosphaera sedula]AKV76453.1 hypothetical protein MsedB_1206 [Metallosphaera sedula]AKV78705.1 hypothetical protein MsedC_1204 [Metallosphaera sedula]